MKHNDVVSSVWIVHGAQQAYSVRQSREAEEYIAVWAVDFMKDCIKELETKNKELQSKLDASNARLDKAREFIKDLAQHDYSGGKQDSCFAHAANLSEQIK